MSAPSDPISARHMEAEHRALWSVALWGHEDPPVGQARTLGLTHRELRSAAMAVATAGRALSGSLDRLAAPELWPRRAPGIVA